MKKFWIALLALVALAGILVNYGLILSVPYGAEFPAEMFLWIIPPSLVALLAAVGIGKLTAPEKT